MNPDFLDMLCELNAAGAEYLVVGAFAMSAHGFSRSTGDIDIWVRPTPDNAKRVMRAITTFGAPLLGLRIEDLHTPDVVFQIGVEPQRIDILTTIEAVTFDEAWPARMIVEFSGAEYPVLDIPHMIINKRAAGRDKDQLDVKRLERAMQRRDEKPEP